MDVKRSAGGKIPYTGNMSFKPGSGQETVQITMVELFFLPRIDSTTTVQPPNRRPNMRTIISFTNYSLHSTASSVSTTSSCILNNQITYTLTCNGSASWKHTEIFSQPVNRRYSGRNKRGFTVMEVPVQVISSKCSTLTNLKVRSIFYFIDFCSDLRFTLAPNCPMMH